MSRTDSFWIAALCGLGLCAAAHGQQSPSPRKPSSPKEQVQAPAPTTPPIVVSNSLGLVIRKGAEGGLEVGQEGRGWVVRDGETKIKAADSKANPPIDLKLQINRFAPGEDTVIVKVNLTPRDRSAEFVKAMEEADKAGAPVLIDAKGRKYAAVGFIYKDPAITQIRFTKGAPLEKMSGAPAITRSTTDRELTLVFLVSLGVEVKEFRVGERVIERYDPAVKCDQKQK